MSKELEALKRFKNNVRWLEENTSLKHYFENTELHFKEDLDIIESALKRLENYEQNEDFNKDVLNYAFLNEQDKIKKLKALEVIKDKGVNAMIIKETDNANEYNELTRHHYRMLPLTQEEFDLLKEVLL